MPGQYVQPCYPRPNQKKSITIMEWELKYKILNKLIDCLEIGCIEKYKFDHYKIRLESDVYSKEELETLFKSICDTLGKALNEKLNKFVGGK